MAEKVKALIIDDELAVLESFKMILEVKDYEVKTAQDMDEAVQAVKNEDFDIAFIDLKFHGKEIGLDILAKIKEIKPSIEAVIVTAFASEKSKIQAVERGAMDYISKPFMMEVIYDLVDRMLERRKKKK